MIRASLISRLFGGLPVFAAGAVNTVLVSGVVAARIPSAAFIGWLILEVTIALARLLVLFLSRRSTGGSASVLTDLHVLLSVGWSASVGYGVLISLASGDWVVATLSCLSAAAMVAGVCFRSFSAPRLVCTQLGLLIVPFMVGAAFAGESVLYAAFLRGPMYLGAMVAAAFQLNQMLIGTLRAKLASDHSAKHDPLTGLLNRAGIGELAEHYRAENIVSTGVLFIDLDDFKIVNDTHGHAVGDRVLKLLAQRLRNVLPEKAEAARIGGDEFVVILPSTSTSDLYDLASGLTHALCKPMELAGIPKLTVLASIGAAAAQSTGESLSSLIERADRAGYEIKNERKQAYAARRVLAAVKDLTAPSGPDRPRLSKAS